MGKWPSGRLPEEHELRTPLQLQLRQNDLRELHSADRLSRLDYQLRLDLVSREISIHCQPGGTVVDVGTAQANLPLALQARGYLTVAVDLRMEFLQYGRMKADGRGLLAVVGSGELLPLPAACADAVVLGELLEHVAHPDRFLGEAARVLRPGGLLVATTPNGAHRWSPLPTFSDANGHLEDYEWRQFGPDGGDHLFLYTAEELEHLVRSAGFTSPRVVHYYSDVAARTIERVQGLRLWPRVGPRWSSAAASVLSRMDELLLGAVAERRRALGLVLSARRR